MSLVTIGMSHKTASLDVREKLAVDKNESRKILKKLHSMPLVDEAIILSTCNRTEIYYEYENHLGQEKRIFHVIMKCLVEYKQYSEGLSPYAIKKTGSIVVSKHLFRLISGLESMVVG